MGGIRDSVGVDRMCESMCTREGRGGEEDR